MSENLVVILRRKALIPTLSKVIQEDEKNAKKTKRNSFDHPKKKGPAATGPFLND